MVEAWLSISKVLSGYDGLCPFPWNQEMYVSEPDVFQCPRLEERL